MKSKALKRIIDLSAATVGLFLFSPIIVCIALIILLADGRPVFFRQLRPGLNGRPFWLIKFRTMNDKCDASGKLLHPTKRITRLGNILRSSSLDEIPQLWNVLKGEMSLVGPRPLRMEYLARYSPDQMRRHEVLPGITGWSQVKGRNRLSWEERLHLDVWYVDNWSIPLDLKIIWYTLFQVLKREGIYSSRGEIMEEFKGNKESAK